MKEDFMQCILFDGNSPKANMHGVECIISERLFETLPDEEKKLWHPHNAEILTGQLMAPGLPNVAEKALMKSKMNSYGKTWHLWDTGHSNQFNDALPFVKQIWSFLFLVILRDKGSDGSNSRNFFKIKINSSKSK